MYLLLYTLLSCAATVISCPKLNQRSVRLNHDARTPPSHTPDLASPHWRNEAGWPRILLL